MTERDKEKVMGHKKDILLHLYGEHNSGEETPELRTLLQDEQLRKEHTALSEVKFRLDHRPRTRPDPEVIDQIIAHAAGERITPGRRVDRPAVLRFRPLRKLMIPALSVAAAIVVTVGVGLLVSGRIRPDAGVQGFADSHIDKAPPESLLRATPVPPGLVNSGGSRTTDPMLAWNEDDQLHDIYRRIRTMKPNTDLDWGEPVPLESLNGLTDGSSSRVRPVGSGH